MAVKTFDEIYAQLSADERKVLDNVFAKEPELKGGWLRQDDYSRRQNELKSKQAEFDEALTYKAKMEPWADKVYERLHTLEEVGVLDPEGNELWTAQKKALEDQLEAAKLTGGDMDPAELDKRVRAIVKESGMALTQTEINNLYANEGRKMAKEVFDQEWKAKETDFNTKTIPMVAGFGARTGVVAMRYEKESGEPWTEAKEQELFKLMSDEQNFNPLAVQEKFFAPLRAKKDEEKRIEEEVNKRLAARGMPGSGEDDGRYIPPPNAPKGSLQQALERDGTASDFESLIKAQSVLAAKELVSEGKV